MRRLTPADLAWRDLTGALGNHRFWLGLSWLDIIQRYRGSILGPFWLTISTAAFIVGLGPLYAGLFSLDPAQYLPFMAISILLWNFISGTLSECCRAFIDAGELMKQVKLPHLTHILHIVCRNTIIFVHTLPIVVCIMLYYRMAPTPGMLLAVPGVLMLCFNLIVIGLLLAIVCARFRDFIQLVGTILQLAFFATPVMWNPKTQPKLAWVAEWNPFNALLELVRAPLLGEIIAPQVLLLWLGCLLVTLAVAAVVFVRFRPQLIYWV